MPHANRFISLNDVSIRLRDRVLFEGLCWEMLADQHWAVIGPNGSGKSTLMKALCGALPVVHGEIVYHFCGNQGPGAAQAHLAHVTFESQRRVLGDEAFYQERWNVGANQDTRSVCEFLSEQSIWSASPYHVIERRADVRYEARRQEIVDRLGIGKLLERNVVALSNGERRQVTIAQALLASPRLLILDNPFAGLDEQFRAKLAENLENLMGGEMRVMLVGTDRDDIPPSITHVLRVQDHRVIAQGPQVLKSAPAGDGNGANKLRNVRSVSAGECGAADAAGRAALVHMEDVSVSYNSRPVLRQVNWTVHPSEQWALLGPNGAGKTTLLSLILADNPQAYANNITLFGQRRGSGESIWEIKRNIGWVAPELQLYYPRDATCLEVVCSGWFDSVGLYRQSSPEQRSAARAWLERFGLAARAETAFEQLSEGEQRLALLARALVKSPTLLVLDEPCQGLDADNRDRVLQAIDGVGRQPNTSMIYVTHRADELPQSITHVLRLDAGRVVEQGLKRK